MNKYQKKDIDEFTSSFSIDSELSDIRVLVTGASGLIGSSLIHCLIAVNKSIEIVAAVRNPEKFQKMFTREELEYIHLVASDIVTYNYEDIGDVEYIVHCAAPTSSRFFVEHPVETFDSIVSGTKALLSYAAEHPVMGFVYLSSLEVYGDIPNGNDGVTEDMQGYWDPISVRSSYPMAKRAAENLCCLYAHQYGVPVKVARLTQTTGAGIAKDDNRVIAQFARLAASNQDIILHTTGESARPYCYVTDAVSAILFILLKGKAGEAYNVANEDTYISAKELAFFVRDNFNPSIEVRIELNKHLGYAPALQLRLSAEKLKALGWMPRLGLREIIGKLIEYLQ